MHMHVVRAEYIYDLVRVLARPFKRDKEGKEPIALSSKSSKQDSERLGVWETLILLLT